MNILDIHTHNLLAENAIINLPMEVLENEQPQFLPGRYYSAGIFPLYAGNWEKAFQVLTGLAENPQILYIGECGLDHRNRENMPLQVKYYKKQLELAEAVQKPVLIHCVHQWNQLMEINQLFPGKEKRIIHGFRGKPQLAKQLLDAGFELSFGLHFHPESFRLCPPDKRHEETDDMKDITIADIQEKHEKWL